MRATEPESTRAEVPERALPLGPWSVRVVREGDIEAVRELLGQVRLPDDGLEDQFGENYVVAESDGKIVGSAGVEVYGRYGLLRSVAVSPGWQGSRIGRSLVLDRLYWARSHGLVSMFALTTTPRYFEHLGFSMVDRNSIPAEVRFSKEFVSVCPESAPAMAIPINGSELGKREEVRSRYGQIARSVVDGTRTKGGRKQKASCCGTSPADSETEAESTGASCCGGDSSVDVENIITANLYDESELGSIPDTAALASLGCGNPTALAELNAGETVLDLGSGGGIDVLLSAKRVGPKGKAYGLDMTDDMLELARKNQEKAGVENVEFLKGEIEDIPLPDSSVDVVISNCVINLSTDKRKVLAEAFRVLKPGGRFAVSDVVARGEVPDEIRRHAEMWVGCIAGTLEEREYTSLLKGVGFDAIEVVPTRVYGGSDLCGLAGDELEIDPAKLDGKFMSAFVRATKPA